MSRLSKLKKVQKPNILKTKIELVDLLEKKIKPLLYQKATSHNYWLRAEYEVNSIKFRIFLQRYVSGRQKMKVNTIDVRRLDNYKALTVTEIKKLLEEVKVL